MGKMILKEQRKIEMKKDEGKDEDIGTKEIKGSKEKKIKSKLGRKRIKERTIIK